MNTKEFSLNIHHFLRACYHLTCSLSFEITKSCENQVKLQLIKFLTILLRLKKRALDLAKKFARSKCRVSEQVSVIALPLLNSQMSILCPEAKKFPGHPWKCQIIPKSKSLLENLFSLFGIIWHFQKTKFQKTFTKQNS